MDCLNLARIRLFTHHRHLISSAVILLFLNISSEEVCKFAYTGVPELLNGKTLVLPEEVVAMSECVYVGNPGDIVEVPNPVSLIFMIDQSVSMRWFSTPNPDELEF